MQDTHTHTPNTKKLNTLCETETQTHREIRTRHNSTHTHDNRVHTHARRRGERERACVVERRSNLLKNTPFSTYARSPGVTPTPIADSVPHAAATDSDSQGSQGDSTRNKYLPPTINKPQEETYFSHAPPRSNG